MRSWTDEELELADRMRSEKYDWDAIGEAFDTTGNSVRFAVSRWNKRKALEFPEIPSKERTVDEIIEFRCNEYNRINDHERACELIEVKVNSMDPIGIAHIGDPHMDDPGSDFPKLLRHVNAINSTPGMYGASIGDKTNNWVGRLVRLYANQSTTEAESIQLIEWFIQTVPWLYLVGGNHDVWSGNKDPIKWFASQAGKLYEWHGVRIGLRFPNGALVVINARHDFPGNSQWNITHGAAKAARMGYRDDIFACGHKHSSGYQTFAVCGKPVHALMVSGYKRWDDFAKQQGYQGTDYMPSAVTIIDPSASEENRVHVETDVENGCDYLTWLRSKVA